MTEDRFTDVMAIFEFRGQYPTVPITEGVDYEALIAGDTDPLFVTMPIGKAGSTSGNKRHYDEEFVQELEKQVLQRRPIGLMGHLKKEDRNTEFPAEAVHWVGAMRENDLLWGKGYVPPGPVRDRVRRYKASGRPMATSIDAQASGEWDKDMGAMKMDGASLDLHQIDFAPADRAGIVGLAVVPEISREMDGDNVDSMEDNPMDKLEVLKGLTAEDAQYIPTEVREAILETVETPAEVAQVTEIRETLNLEGDADINARIKEILAEKEEQLKTQISGKITELVDEGIKLESARPLVRRLVELEAPESVEKVQECYDKVIADEAVTELLKAKVDGAGPEHKGTKVPKTEAKYFVIPTDEEK
ncbi:MAG: hypothetical protein ACYTEQ_17745 [Planctomycetota bacterium]|jgi:hypothetical protein